MAREARSVRGRSSQFLAVPCLQEFSIRALRLGDSAPKCAAKGTGHQGGTEADPETAPRAAKEKKGRHRIRPGRAAGYRHDASQGICEQRVSRHCMPGCEGRNPGNRHINMRDGDGLYEPSFLVCPHQKNQFMEGRRALGANQSSKDVYPTETSVNLPEGDAYLPRAAHTQIGEDRDARKMHC